jgi:hypothetical protein
MLENTGADQKWTIQRHVKHWAIQRHVKHWTIQRHVKHWENKTQRRKITT